MLNFFRSGTHLLAAVRIITYGLSGLATILIARSLGPHSYGVYATGVAVVGLVLIVGVWGQDQLFLKSHLTIQDTRVRLLQVGILSFILIAAAALLWPGLNIPSRIVVGLMGLATIIQWLFLPYLLEPLKSFDLRLRAKRELTRRSIFPILGATIGWLAGHTAISFALGYLIAGVLLLLSTQPLGGVWASVKSRPWRDLRFGLPFALSGIFFTIYFQVDVALLGTLSTPQTVGIYSAATAMLSGFLLFSILLSNEIMRSRLFALVSDSRRFRGQAIQDGLPAVAVGLLSGACCFLIGPWLITLLYGAMYAPGGVYLQIFGLATVLFYIANWASNVALAAGYVAAVVFIQVFLAVVNIVFNVILIPRYGALASAWVTTACELIGCIAYICLIAVTRFQPREMPLHRRII